MSELQYPANPEPRIEMQEDLRARAEKSVRWMLEVSE